ncbi:MAG TPA: type II toxin-antitoxin system VapC family toxin [Acidiferrobacterales bacterium]|nr:type II toxin-antitoxin system VapC family toxin [Acidiferrobacterales bacterium]
MSRYVVDASVAIKWFVPEVHAEAAARLLEGDNQLLAPDLLFPEFGNILWKKARLGEIRVSEAREILRALEAVPLQVHTTQPLIESAFEIAYGLERSVYDSVYLSLAVINECRMITADKKFYNVLKNSSLAEHIEWVEASAA